jgi:periplasmic protein TonB
MTPPASPQPSSIHRPQQAISVPRLNPQQFFPKDENFGRSQLASALVHAALGALLLLPLFAGWVAPPHPRAPLVPALDFAPLISAYLPRPVAGPPQPSHGGGSGGGGERDTVTKGTLPAFLRTQIMPPALVRNPNPTLELPPNIVGPENLRITTEIMANWGDPAAEIVNSSTGQGCCAGLGNQSGTGVGQQGDGSGYGPGGGQGTGNGLYTLGGGSGVSFPACAYCPHPDYSEEARKAKLQGTVLLSVIVLPNGQAGEVEVLSSPGLGLDQKAVASVRSWRFRPAHDASGRAVAARISIEVVFQLF